MKTIRRGRRCVIASVLFVGALSAGTASAGVITYSDRTVWEAAAGPLSWTENFDSFLVDTSFATAPLDLGPFSLYETATIGYGGVSMIDVAPFYGAPGGYWFEAPVNGTPYALLTTVNYDSPDNVTANISFDAGVGAWGVDFRAGPNTYPVAVELYLTNGTLLTTIVGPGGFPGFFGFTTTAGESIGRLRFYNPGQGPASLGFDNMAAVTNGLVAPTQVPEPSTLILLGTGVLCLTGRMRPRR